MLQEKAICAALCCALFVFGAAGISHAAEDLPPGFIALSEKSGMNYTDAVAFCKEMGGKLPRINNSDSWDGKNPPWKGVPVDGFGKGNGPWPDGLPRNYYWTGQEAGAFDNSWHIRPGGGIVILERAHQRNKFRAACVP